MSLLCAKQQDRITGTDARTSTVGSGDALAVLLVIVASVLLTGQTFAEPPAADKKVLILNSYHSQYAGGSIINGVLEGLKNVVADENIHIEHMDTRRHYDDQAYLQMLSDIYHHKFRNVAFDVVITIDDNAFDFSREHRDTLFSNVSVVFCGVNFFEESLDTPDRWFTGTIEGNAIRQNFELITRIQPEAKEVIVLSDQTSLGTVLISEAQDAIASLKDTGLTFTIWNDFTYQQLLDRVAGLSSDTVLFLSLIQKDNAGRHFSYKDDFPVLCQSSSVPVYGMWGLLNGRGAVGGYMNSQYDIGLSAAALAKRVLAGQSPSEIPIKQDPYIPTFDDNQLKRFKIDKSRLPADSVIINEPFDVYFVYKEIVWVSAGFGLLLLFIVVYLLVQIKLRKKAEQRTARGQAEVDSIFAASPAGIGLVRDRKLIRSNERFWGIAGRRPDQLIGIDSRSLYLNQQDYEEIGRKYQQACEEGVAVVETHWVRPDNVVIDVMLYLSPVDAADPNRGFVIIVQDISDMKAARQQAAEEKERAQLYLDVANVLLLVLDAAGRVRLINKKGCEILEAGADQIEGQDWFKSFLPASYQAVTWNAFQRLMSGEEKSLDYFENPVRTAGGKERLIAWHNRLLRDESGAITGVISSGLDVTAERAAENALRDSDQRLRLALSAAQTGTWQWRAATRQETRDANFNALLGLKAVESTQAGEDIFKFVHPEDRDAVRQALDRAIDGTGDYLVQFRIVRPDGEIRWVLDQGKPFYDYNGKLDYITGAIVDITQQVEYQQRYQNIIDSAPMGIHTYSLEPDGRLVMTGANPASGEILGRDFSEALGHTIEDVFPALVETEIPEIYRRLCGEGGIYHGNNFEYHDDNVEGYYEFTAFQASPGNMATLFLDVTERVLIQKTLQFTQFAVDRAGEAAYWMGRDAKFVYVNDKACQSLGYTCQELLSMTVHDIDPDFPAAIWGDYWDKMRREPLLVFDSHHKKKDGTVFPVEITANFVVYDGREYICAFARDITERKAAEHEREVLMEQLRQRNDELQSIVFTAAHDLRSPLVNITGFAGELEKGLRKLEALLDEAKLDKSIAEKIAFLLTTDIAESLNFVLYGSQHMDMLLNGLMRLSVVGAASIELGTVDMNRLFDGIIDGLQYSLNESEIDISVPKDLPDCLGDYAMLTQVFSNLIDNAIKYSHPDRKAIIEIGASTKEDAVEYTVADNGIGIEAAHLEKVFELFHQLRSKQVEGQGLGLTIVRRILDRLGGSAWIDSVPGLGTTVHIRLPRS